MALAFLPAIGQAIIFRNRISWQASDLASETVTVDLARSWGANVLWVDAQRFIVIRNRAIVFALVVPREATIVVGKCMAWIDAQRFAVVGYRAIVVAFIAP